MLIHDGIRCEGLSLGMGDFVGVSEGLVMGLMGRGWAFLGRGEGLGFWGRELGVEVGILSWGRGTEVRRDSARGGR